MNGGRDKTHGWGSLFGLLTFLTGIALLLLTFSLAYRLFGTPPETVFGPRQGEALDLARAGQSLFDVIWRIAMLLVMVVVGSVTANRGIRLYLASREAPKILSVAESESGPPAERAS